MENNGFTPPESYRQKMTRLFEEREAKQEKVLSEDTTPEELLKILETEKDAFVLRKIIENPNVDEAVLMKLMDVVEHPEQMEQFECAKDLMLDRKLISSAVFHEIANRPDITRTIAERLAKTEYAFLLKKNPHVPSDIVEQINKAEM